MRRDQLKILLSGILILLLGSLIVYSYLFREDISRFLKKKEGEEVSNNSKTDRVILSPEMNSEPLVSPKDLNSLPDSGEFPANEKETSKETKAPSDPGEYSSNAKETQSSQEERLEEKKTHSVEKMSKDKFPEERWAPPKDEASAIKDEEYSKEKMKNVRDEREKKSDLKTRSQHTKKKTKIKKRFSIKTGKRIRSLETRVDRLERKLGITHTRKKHKRVDRKGLEKRVWKLEKEMEKLKFKK
ncbi:hypothetical protein FH581_006440 [Leptospira weilii]|uniref:hypothetical protein n=1 Tax=Leptospira weilii TaxID=28184 RepID=UPI001EF3C850|nr:hypothetical protein [Leptospira weilii]ULH29882.1 hypothetical protein FH586_08510 [Leptospira weilii]UPY78496.1 hypothetical protein FH581_006440 [Leptospira weilii]